MLNPVSSRAPGKLLVTGEYAVLDGAPALVMAVDREVAVSLAPAPSGKGRLSAVPLGIEKVPLRIADGRVTTDGDGARLGVTGRFLAEAMPALDESTERLADLDIAIDSSALFEKNASGATVKLGLGSSAAVAAALAVALEAAFGGPFRDDAASRLARWLPVYRRSLSSRASGADLAAAFAGGLIEYSAPEDRPCLARRAWPPGLARLALWVGSPACTENFVARFERWKGEDASAASRLDDLAERARACADAVHDARALVRAARDYAAGIEALGRAMNLEIVTPVHRELSGLAEGMGLLYKSCGAGGGDLGLALDDDPDRLRAFARRAARVGAVPVHLGLSEQGARTTPAPGRSGAGD